MSTYQLTATPLQQQFYAAVTAEGGPSVDLVTPHIHFPLLNLVCQLYVYVLRMLFGYYTRLSVAEYVRDFMHDPANAAYFSRVLTPDQKQQLHTSLGAFKGRLSETSQPVIAKALEVLNPSSRETPPSTPPKDCQPNSKTSPVVDEEEVKSIQRLLAQEEETKESIFFDDEGDVKQPLSNDEGDVRKKHSDDKDELKQVLNVVPPSDQEESSSRWWNPVEALTDALAQRLY